MKTLNIEDLGCEELRVNYEHVVTDFNFPQGRIAGTTDEKFLQDGFSAILSFLGACAESRRLARSRGKDEMDGENSGLFPAHVGEWVESVRDEIAMLEYQLDESETDLIEA